MVLQQRINIAWDRTKSLGGRAFNIGTKLLHNTDKAVALGSQVVNFAARSNPTDPNIALAQNAIMRYREGSQRANNLTRNLAIAQQEASRAFPQLF